MEVILLERVEKLGAIGDVVKVKNGFARNYLLPRKKALRANDANRKLFDAQRAQIEADNAAKRSDAEKASKGVEGKSVQLIRQASNVGHLYGSVSARDIAEALEGVGAKVAKSQVVLDRPIKAIGLHEVKVALHPEVSVTVKVNVARSPEEADLQAQGVDVLQQMFEEQAAPMAAEDLAPAAEEGVEETPAAAEAVEETPAADEAPAEAAAEAPAAEATEEAPAAEAGEAEASEEEQPEG
jgi:large subunit ribosomal protein L9